MSKTFRNWDVEQSWFWRSFCELQSEMTRPLRLFQKKALQILNSSAVNLVCQAPTGSGKSLIFETIAQDPSVRMLLVTPLVALGVQQVEKFRALGITVRFGSESDFKGSGKFGQVWITSPEGLFQNDTLIAERRLREWMPNFLTVDECHCYWEWGESFRPEFYRVPSLVSQFEIKRSLWLTATLPPDARVRLKAHLPDPVKELGGFGLPETLGLRVFQVPLGYRLEALKAWVENQTGPGVVFVNTRKQIARLERVFQSWNLEITSFHAGFSKEEKDSALLKIKKKPPRVILATSAFGMGMDIGDLEWVVLWQIPFSLTDLSQKVGRVARQGKTGVAAVFWDWDDFSMMSWSVGDSEKRKKDLQELKNYFYLMSEGDCPKRLLEQYFQGESVFENIP